MWPFRPAARTRRETRTKREAPMKLVASVLLWLLALAVGWRVAWQAGAAQGFANGSWAAGKVWQQAVASDLAAGRLVLGSGEDWGDFGAIPGPDQRPWVPGRPN
jgi:hypothetical protein